MVFSPSCRLETMFVYQGRPQWQAGKGWRELERDLMRSTVQFSSAANPHVGVTIRGDGMRCSWLASSLWATNKAVRRLCEGQDKGEEETEGSWWRISGLGAPGATQATD